MKYQCYEMIEFGGDDRDVYIRKNGLNQKQNMKYER